MNERQLQHIYQAWCQGNDNPRRDWSFFVEFAAKRLNIPADEVMRTLQRCLWFEYIPSE